jgi:hypothetical protein
MEARLITCGAAVGWFALCVKVKVPSNRASTISAVQQVTSCQQDAANLTKPKAKLRCQDWRTPVQAVVQT